MVASKQPDGSKIDGASLLAKSLKEQGIEYAFGVPGIPVIPVAFKLQEYGIKYVSCRTEQSVRESTTSKLMISLFLSCLSRL